LRSLKLLTKIDIVFERRKENAIEKQ